MKRRAIMALGLALSLSLTAVGCSGMKDSGTAAEAAADTTAYAGQTVYGVVQSVDEEAGTVTVTLGELSADGTTVTEGEESLVVPITEETRVSAGRGMRGDKQPPEMPEGWTPGQGGEMPSLPEGQQPPEMPEGWTPGQGGEMPSLPDGQQPPEKPDGETPSVPEGEQSDSGTAEQDSSGQTEGKSEEKTGRSKSKNKPDGKPGNGGGRKDFDKGGHAPKASLTEGDSVAVTFDEEGKAAKVKVLSGSRQESQEATASGDSSTATAPAMSGAPGGMPGTPGGGAPESYDAATVYSGDAEESGKSIESSGTDENAVLVDSGASVKLSGMTISRKSANSTGGDTSSFYGVGAAVLVTDGAVTVADSTIDTDAAGGAGVFAYGSGIARVSDTVIRTVQGTSGGIHVAGGGTLYASNVTATTEGGSSAAIRSDRGGGTMVVDGGSFTSNGTGSPAIYSTADITVNSAQLAAPASEAICIEGKNTIRLFDCDLSGNMPDQEQNDCTWNVILYQSMSGDAAEGNSTFEMIGGTLTAGNGGMFYTTNTESTFILENVDITNAEENVFFLKATGNSNSRGWGSAGANGADCLFTAISQKMEGDVIWDSISELDMYLTSGSTLTGAVTDDESNAGSGGDGYCRIIISSDSTWVVTGDSVLTELDCEGTIVDESGKSVTVRTADGTVLVQGDSSYSITVDSYSEKADLSGASQTDSWSEYSGKL